MTEAAIQAADADAHPSQVIEHRETDLSAQGQGAKLPQADAPKEDEKKPLSTRDAISKAFDESEAKAKSKAEADAEKGDKEAGKAEDGKKGEDGAKADAKQPYKAADKAGEVDKDAKAAEQAKNDKGAADKPTAGQGGEEARQSEGRKHTEPPARFLPDARTKWANVPNEVKAEVHRVSQEYETELETLKTQSKETSERYEPLRKYDEQARSNGRNLEQSLQKVTQIEQNLTRNPVIGLELILREIGPRKGDGSPVTLHDIATVIAKQTPQQFAQNMNGALGQSRQPAPQAQQQQSPEVAALSKELQSIKSQLAVSQAQPIVEAFKVSRPDYAQIEPQIAEILSSGVIAKLYGTGLTPEQKLEQAYRMAGGQGPSSQSAAPAPATDHSQTTPVSPVDPDGQKSITGAPSSGQTGEPKRKFKSNRAALEAAFGATR